MSIRIALAARSRLEHPVVSLLHMDGTAASTAFPDTRGSVWTAEGAAAVSTTAPKFGTGCLTLNGSASWIQAPGDQRYMFGTSDFTVEGFFKTTRTASQCLIDFYMTNASGSWQLFQNAAGYISFYKTVGGSGIAVASQTSGTAITDGNYHHVAASRVSGTLRLFVDGVVAATATDATNYNSLQGLCTVGAQVNSRNATYDFNGTIDEVRISKKAWYSAAFTPPTAPFT